MEAMTEKLLAHWVLLRQMMRDMPDGMEFGAPGYVTSDELWDCEEALEKSVLGDPNPTATMMFKDGPRFPR